MSIEPMPVVLTWSGGANVVERVHDRYESHATSALWETVERIRYWDRQLAGRLDRGIGEAGRDELQRALLAPETTIRLLGRRPDADDAVVGRFLHRSLLAEAARADRPAQCDDTIWTALGDGRLLPSGEFKSGPSIPGFVPLDFDSPYAPRAGVWGPQGPGSAARTVLDQQERRVALERLTAARNLIQKTSSTVDAVVSRLTKVLMLRRDEQGIFSSGSNEECVGRSIVVHPHAPQVDEIDLAEAVVHEAVRSLLSMEEVLQAWVLDRALREDAPRVLSRWTGHPLPLRFFLQECFVRYGLLHFWYLVLGVGAADPERIRERIRETMGGFLGGPLLDHVSPYAGGIGDEVKAAIRQMQIVVASNFDADVA